MTVIEKAYAKINLYLDVLGRRDDGFHDILSVMHSVDLCDTVVLSAEASDKTEIRITTNIQTLPVDEGNIVNRAVRKYLSYFSINAVVNVTLDKLIPIGAGLGGGSSDAAATLRAMNKIFCRADIDQLLYLASDLGSDVPFCLLGGLYLCGGRGEKLTKIEGWLSGNFVVAIGNDRVSTPTAYAALDKKYNNFLDYNVDYISSTYRKMIVDLALGEGITVPFYNIFEQVARLEEINKIKEMMIKSGADYTLMSGSGPSVFGSFIEKSDAEVACKELLNKGFTAFVCHSVYPEVNI